MGLQIEINTMFRLGADDPKPETLVIGQVFKTSKSNLRLYPVGLPIILLSEDWHALGYCVVKAAAMSQTGMNLEIEIISLFNEQESQIHTDKVIEALTKTHYLPPKK